MTQIAFASSNSQQQQLKAGAEVVCICRLTLVRTKHTAVYPQSKAPVVGTLSCFGSQ